MNNSALLAQFGRSRFFKRVTLIVLVCFTLLVTNGCVAIDVQNIPIKAEAETPSIAMKMYLEEPGEEGLDHVINGLRSALSFKNAEGKFVQVSSSMNGQWILQNAPAGTYRLELAESFVYDGEPIKLTGSRTATFRLPADNRAEIQIILKKTPIGWIIVLSVVVIGLIILAIAAGEDLPDILIPPLLPDPSLLVPPVPVLLSRDLFFPPLPGLRHAGPLPPPPTFIDFGVYVAPHSHVVAAAALTAVHFHPHDGDFDVPAGTNIEVWFSADVDERSLDDPTALTVSGSESGPVYGETEYIRPEKKLVFTPEKLFARNEAVTVKIDGKRMLDRSGRPMESDSWWSFSTEAQ